MKAKSVTWSEHLQRQKTSGITINAYCERYGISPGMFFYWKRKFSSVSAVPKEVFQEVEIIPDRLIEPVIEVYLAGNKTFRIKGYVSAAFLRELAGC